MEPLQGGAETHAYMEQALSISGAQGRPAADLGAAHKGAADVDPLALASGDLAGGHVAAGLQAEAGDEPLHCCRPLQAKGGRRGWRGWRQGSRGWRRGALEAGALLQLPHK